MDPIHAAEGWFVSHLFYRVDRPRWEAADPVERQRRKQHFQEIVDDFRRDRDRQIHCYSIWGLKADLAVMTIDPDLQHLNETEVAISTALGAGVLEPKSSFISMSEISEYMSQEKDYDRTLRNKDGLTPDSTVYQQKMAEFRGRMRTYIDDRLYPRIPDHRLLCFYPMSKRRGDRENWYLLDFDTRKTYMAGHAITGRKFHATVKQLVTGSIGLDDWEWGVSLFSDDPFHFKKILYEMRYDEASARFGEFGPFYVGLRFEPMELFERLAL
jgi:hydrogen peroxide-dependent heme synthase